MTFSWIKPFSWGVAAGAAAWWIILASVFNWTSPSTAQKMADRQSDEAVVAALAPVCAAKFMAQPDAAMKKAELAKASSWDRRDMFPQEWVTLPGESYRDAGLVIACSKLVLEAPAKVSRAS